MFITSTVKTKIESMLQLMEERVSILQLLQDHAQGFADNPIYRNAAERALHIAVECVTDVGNELIDSLVMRDAGGYSDIVKVLAEESVVTNEWYEQFLGAIDFRRHLVRDYRSITPADVKRAVCAYKDLFAPYATFVRNYLNAN